MKADADLVRSCLEGDGAAFGELVQRYERPVFNAAYRMLGGREDAGDVCQTVFLRAWENLAKYDAQRPFFSWIYRIAVNESLRVLDRRGPVEEIPETVPSPEPGPDVRFSGSETSRAVQQALDAMTPDYRAVIVLRHFLDASYQDMAEALGVPEKMVKSRLFSARQRLRAMLEAKGILGS